MALRTSLFRDVDRSPDAIQAFERLLIAREGEEDLDPDIHVCRFVGFVDAACRTVGCLLHPSAPGNSGQDLRGLCYYGSLACKTFYCDAWHVIPHRYLTIISDVIHDWHLWGLVAADAEFVLCLFSLLETAIQQKIDPLRVKHGPAREILISMVGWKNEWPMANRCRQRLSRYYHRPSKDFCAASCTEAIGALTECLDFTFATQSDPKATSRIIRSSIDRFAEFYKGEREA